VAADGAGDTDADVIVSGREPRQRPRRPGPLIWLLVIAETAALAVWVAIAVHDRGPAGGVPRGAPPAASPPGSPMPEVTSVALRLPADGGVTGTVVITAAALPGAVLAQFIVSAVITGGTPGTFYDLIGSDCSTASPLGDHVWATGLTSANGTADLVGYAWTGAATDFYWLAPGPVTGQPSARPARTVHRGPGGAVPGRPGAVRSLAVTAPYPSLHFRAWGTPSRRMRSMLTRCRCRFQVR
jgi:hypothetical protein